MADTHWYVDTTLATGANDGTSPTDAWQSLVTALQYASFNASNRNIIWVRRTSSHTMIADINFGDDGSAEAPILYVSWPRAINAGATGATWTNGSTIVDLVTGLSMAKKHLGRYVVAPDGSHYLVTRIIDSNTFIIDRKYAGATVTTTSGDFDLDADELYDDRSAAGISAGWDADPEDLPLIDGNSANFCLNAISDLYYGIIGFELKDGGDASYGIFRIVTSKLFFFQGCILSTITNESIAFIQNTFIDKCIIHGNSTGTLQRLLNTADYCKITNSAIYGAGDLGINMGSYTILDLDNVNIGVEVANNDADIALWGMIKGTDVKFGGSNGYIDYATNPSPTDRIEIENYQKILGENKTWFIGGEAVSTIVSGEIPNKKLSDAILKITPNISDYIYSEKEWRVRIPLGLVNMDTGNQTIKFWLYNDLGVTINSGDPMLDIFLEANYIDSHDDTSKYTRTKIVSTEQDILDAADADDWDSISVVVNPTVKSLVSLYLVINLYNVNDFFIDPQMVIT